MEIEEDSLNSVADVRNLKSNNSEISFTIPILRADTEYIYELEFSTQIKEIKEPVEIKQTNPMTGMFERFFNFSVESNIFDYIIIISLICVSFSISYFYHRKKV